MAGVNGGIPVPLAFFSFTGNKQPFLGVVRTLDREGLRFCTRVKTVTTRWTSPEESGAEKVSTWEGTINRAL
jgi:malonate-semialdehyde dehydrogenase (acetylating)/methylmalonate-semialdehyde dehydrogenase